ncbi:adapter protein MecA 1/2 [Bacillus ectoiniformans]|uniref:adaptor protein MecA n=1 Tax=Bacillus ectoiniformans TaxID=1494429 RepID=UPI001956FF5F|nr:adaptor protein MecA [Bacillus ectoiniformans]MBM7648015.1 adapter protein MecA 1/2 [Bacillus ectoiniformans]
MRIERLSDNKVMLSVTFEELRKKGCLKKHILEDSFIWHEIFDDMLDAIEEQLDIDTEGMIAIEIHSMAEHELVLILTIEQLDLYSDFSDWPTEQIEAYECEHTFKFQDIEHVIGLVHDDQRVRQLSSTLYYFKDAYYACFTFDYESQYDDFDPVLMEYGSYSSLSNDMLNEYAIPVIRSDAMRKMFTYFVNPSS